MNPPNKSSLEKLVSAQKAYDVSSGAIPAAMDLISAHIEAAQFFALPGFALHGSDNRKAVWSHADNARDLSQSLLDRNLADADLARQMARNFEKLSEIPFPMRTDVDSAPDEVEAGEREIMDLYADLGRRASEIWRSLYNADPCEKQSALDLANWCVRPKAPGLVIGDKGLSVAGHEEAFEILSRLLRTFPNDEEIQKKYADVSHSLGILYFRRNLPGDIARGGAQIEIDLAVSETILHKSSRDFEWAKRAWHPGIKISELKHFRGLPEVADLVLKYLTLDQEVQERSIAADATKSGPPMDMASRTHELALGHQRRGQPGDEALALKYHLRAAGVAQKYYEANPRDEPAIYVLAESLGKLADFYRRRGDTDGETFFQDQAAQVRHAYFEFVWVDEDQLRESTYNIESMGYYYRDRGFPGDDQLSETLFRHAQVICDKYLADSPQTEPPPRKELRSRCNMGKFYEERGRAGDDALALDQFLIAQGIAEELYKRSPMTSEPMRDLAFVLEKVGGHNVGIGTPQSLALAIRPLSKAVRFREMLAKWQSDESEKTALAHSLGLLGDYYLACGEPDKLDKALKFFIEATKLCQEVLATTPNYPDASQTLLSLENWISEFYRRRDTPGDSEHGRVH